MEMLREQRLTAAERKFIVFWEEKKDSSRFKKWIYWKGFSGGILMGTAILILLNLNWYQRATMVSSSYLSPILYILIFTILAAFCGYIYTNWYWEKNNQQYIELIEKEKSN